MTFNKFRSILNNVVKLRRFIAGKGKSREEMMDDRMRENLERMASLDE